MIELVDIHAGGRPGYLDMATLAYMDPDTNEWTAFPIYRKPPLALVFEVSEMIYNLKVALDYATYALFQDALSKGLVSPADFKSLDEFTRFEKGVQFPIRDTPNSFASWATKNRKWLASKDALFETLQPYKRPVMRFLGDSYHNLDKHRGIQELSIDIDLADAAISGTEALISTDHFVEWQGIRVYGFETEEPMPAHAAVSMYTNAAVEVLLSDGHPLVPTLEILQSEIRALIDALDTAL